MKTFTQITLVIFGFLLIPPAIVMGLYVSSFKYALTFKQSENAEIDDMTHYGNENVYKATLVHKWHMVDVEFLTPFTNLNDMNQIWIPAEGMRGGSQLVTVLWVRIPPEKMKAEIAYTYRGKELPITGRYIYEKQRYDEELRKSIFVGKPLTTEYISDPPKKGYYLLQTYDIPTAVHMMPNFMKFVGGVQASFDLEMLDKGNVRTATYELDLTWRKTGDILDALSI